MTNRVDRHHPGALSGAGSAWPRRVLTAATAVALSVVGIAVPAAAAATSSVAPHRIGAAPVVPAGAVRVADPAAGTTLHLDVELAPRDPAALAAFVAAVSTPSSPRYRQYLAKGQFASAFGPTSAAIRAVTDELTAAGLRPGPASVDGLTIPVTATLAQAQQAFATGFAGYRLPGGRTAFANTAAPQVSGSIAGLVSGVVGLNDVLTQTPRHTQARAAVTTPVSGATGAQAVRPASATPTMCPGLQSVLTTSGLTDTKNYWEPATLSAGYAYGSGQLYSQYGNTGSGVSVGLFELENFDSRDVAGYQSCFGTNVRVGTVQVDGGPTLAPDPNQNIGVESALDIETVAGLAPGSSITVYQGPDSATDQQVLDTYQRMVTDDSTQVISTSWGGCEADINAIDPGVMGAESNIFAAAAAQGQTVFAASGDSGSTSCYGNPQTTRASVLSVDDPAGQPYVTAVGGTRMTGSGPAVQSTWNTPAGGGYAGAASGGGVSAIETLSGTADYQAGVVGAGYSNACGASSGTTCRQVPDVSALADPTTGYLIADGQATGGGQNWIIIGGTSGAAPLWASIAALADASTACAADGSVGFANPALYANQAAMTDVTTGNNVVPDSGYTGSLYQAGTGYDLATGLGAPKAPQLVEALCAAPPAGRGSTFQPQTPTRVVDTRTSSPIHQYSQISLQLTGANGVPPGGVTAVVLNVTATNPTASSFLTVFPDGVARPTSSSVNFSAGQTISNLVTVPVGADGRVDVYNLNGNVDVVADLFGYYTTGAGSLYQPTTPVRMLDTRTGSSIKAGQALGLQIAGVQGVPASGVTAVVLNVTATNPTASSFLTVFPDGVARPTSSNLNFSAAQTISNLVTVPVGADGKVDIYNKNGSVDVIADLSGYYTSSGSGYLFHASTPHRLADTRTGQGVAAGQRSPVGQGGVFGLPLTDTLGTGNAGPLAASGGLVLNVTVTQPSANSFVTVYPSGVGRPVASNLNFVAGQTIPNAAVTAVNGNSVDLYNLSGTVQLVVDVFGYFAQT